MRINILYATAVETVHHMMFQARVHYSQHVVKSIRVDRGEYEEAKGSVKGEGVKEKMILEAYHDMRANVFYIGDKRFNDRKASKYFNRVGI